MRIHAAHGGLTVQAIAGTNVVLLGFDLNPSLTDGLMGFSIHRVDHTEGEERWLPNMLLFKVNDVESNPDRSSEHNPIQTFRWGDYTAKPGHTYSYTVMARDGRPGALGTVARSRLQVSVEGFSDAVHGVVFNRGAMASQQYVARFGSRQPDAVANREAWRWLSRGLEESLLAFIGQATGPRWALRAAVYEFTYGPVLDAFRIAASAGADVRIVVDTTGKADGHPRAANEPAIDKAGIAGLVVERTHTDIAHNKFIVASYEGVPRAVWTGSTNITEGGIFGQSNVGHVVRDRTMAEAYLAYWNQLAADPARGDIKAWNDAHPAIPPPAVPQGAMTVFSPRGSLGALEWYATLADQARSSMFLTGAFGVSKQLQAILRHDKPYLRYVLLDTDRGGAALTIRTADRDNRVTVGATIPRGGFGQWVREATLDANKHVRFVHTKFLLIDPLSADPIVVTGSANFSEASTTDNDENMLVVRGDTALADVYLTEFMRLFTHYEFRAATRRTSRLRVRAPRGDALGRGRRHLYEAPGEWVPRWYVPDSARAKERVMFSKPAG